MMIDIASVISAGAANPWIYLPAAVLLGAAHGLEPGHAKSMMAAFIVAIRGSKAQAVLLGQPVLVQADLGAGHGVGGSHGGQKRDGVAVHSLRKAAPCSMGESPQALSQAQQARGGFLPGC